MKTSYAALSLIFVVIIAFSSNAQSHSEITKAQKNYQSGHEKLNKGDFKGAVEDMTIAIKLNPDNNVIEKVDTYEFRNEIVYALRALSKLQLKEYRSAIDDCGKAIEVDPKYSYAYYVRALVKKALSDFEGSIIDFTKTIELAPKNNWAFYDRGLVKHFLKDYNGAISDYNQAIKLFDRMGVAYYQRALAKTALGDKEGAKEDMNLAANYGVKEAKTPLQDIENVIKNYKK